MAQGQSYLMELCCKWGWDLALEPSPAFPLFTHSCAAHVQLAGSSPSFGLRHSQVPAPEVAPVTSWCSPPPPWPCLSPQSCSTHFKVSCKRRENEDKSRSGLIRAGFCWAVRDFKVLSPLVYLVASGLISMKELPLFNSLLIGTNSLKQSKPRSKQRDEVSCTLSEPGSHRFAFIW